ERVRAREVKDVPDRAELLERLRREPEPRLGHVAFHQVERRAVSPGFFAEALDTAKPVRLGADEEMNFAATSEEPRHELPSDEARAAGDQVLRAHGPDDARARAG